MENFEQELSFSDYLIESEISPVHKGRGKLFEIKDNPDKIVRVETFEDLERRYKGRVDPIVVGELGQKLYGELKSNYGIDAPVEFLAGKDSRNNDVIYGIVDKIDGVDLGNSTFDSKISLEVENLYEKIAQYYLDKMSVEDGLYLADINNPSQYVYGKKKGDVEPHIYLVDTDLYIRDGKVALCNVVLWLYRHIISVEKQCGTKFIHVREIIEHILTTPLPQNITEAQRVAAQKIIEKTKGYLDGRISVDDEDNHPIFSKLD